jgi:hypothetical protein
MRRVCLAAVLLLAARAPAAADFDRDVAPLIARRCLDCHSGADPKGGLDLSRKKAALATLTAGKPDDSTLYQRVRDGEMPPKKTLSASEKATLRDWIAGGAKWGSDPIDPFRVTTDGRAGYDWWSLCAVVRAAPPAVRDAAWARNPIDRFILAKLEAKRLSPSPEADRRTLIRRLSFDLTGLPPTPEDVAAFVSDRAPDAYERVVDRLLSSPGYGERWARHWLDVVRFGESDGFERDLPRYNAWPYRDWVVNALNAGLSYDEFVRLQLAGDVLKPDDPDALAATGFLVAGPHDIVVPVSENMKASMRQDELEDVVGTVGQTFLGLTVHCARCHDHKFDPVSQKDYYRLASSLAGVGFGERPFASKTDRDLPAKLSASAEKLRQQIAAIEEPVRRKLLAEKRKDKAAGPRALAEWDFTVSLDDCVGKLHAKLHGGAKRDQGGIRLDGKTAFVSTAPLAASLGAKTLEAWVKLDNLMQAGGGVISVQTTDGNVFDAIVFGERQKGRWMPGSDGFRRTRDLIGPAEVEATKRAVHVAIVYHADGTVTAYRDGKPYGKPYRADHAQTFAAGKAQVVFGLRHGPVGGNKMLAGTVTRARLYDRALSADEVAASAGLPVFQAEEITSRLEDAQRRKRQALLEEVGKLDTGRAAIESRLAQKTYAVTPSQPPLTHVLARGAVTAKGEVVSAEVPAALPALTPNRLKADAPEGERRAALAKWVTDSKNPLFARVIVNRLWHYHFGLGLVETTSDLGFNGGRPSHPELLDWLAGELVRQGFSLKAMHRLIVTSAAYRQASKPRKEAQLIDADNRLVWRHSPVRLEAEAVRDAILSTSGELDRQMGGRPYLDFRTYFFKGTQFYDALAEIGPTFARRSLYRMWARGGRSPLLDTLDCPDPSTTTPRRARTTTPLQALALFNNAFVLDQADHFAARVRREAGNDADKQIERVYALAYGRAPTEREWALVRPFVKEHGLEALGRVIFNTSEFVQAD